MPMTGQQALWSSLTITHITRRVTVILKNISSCAELHVFTLMHYTNYLHLLTHLLLTKNMLLYYSAYTYGQIVAVYKDL